MNPPTTTVNFKPIEIQSPLADAGPDGGDRPGSLLDPLDGFVERHLGPSGDEIAEMLSALGVDSLDALIGAAVPAGIRADGPLALGPPRGERQTLDGLREIAERNEIFRSCIGMGYHDCVTPAVIQRNVLENPGWYTQYTPYQAEIAQGRLEALLTFQTMVADLTSLPLANSSLLDEATAAAEAMAMCVAIARKPAGGAAPRFFVAADCHPQTIAVVRSRAGSMGVELLVDDPAGLDPVATPVCGALVQYPATDGRIVDHEALAARVHEAGGLLVVACDLLALTVLRPPGEFGADIAVGSAQRFGVPLGGGGPHAAFLATHEQHARKVPGRIVGVSRDVAGNPAYRLAIQTREQHIRRDRATSNICTAQVLLAIMAAMYAVYHGPEGLRRIAGRVRGFTGALAQGLRHAGHDVDEAPFFDTLRVVPSGCDGATVLARARERRVNLRAYDDGAVGIALDETTTAEDVATLLECFGADRPDAEAVVELAVAAAPLPARLARTSGYLTHEVFHRYRSETEMLRYLRTLQSRDLSLADSMIPLGSCTMKLNATSEMLPVTWPHFARIHPFAPEDQTRGYAELFRELESWLAEITGFRAVSLQPNAGSQGEYTGLLVIRAYHQSRGDAGRDVCLIPVSAHGTNPASAVIAGMRVVPISCDDHGNIDLDDLSAKAAAHADALAALMITYPSTHGVFEESVREVCRIVHEHGGQVYLDGANLNAMVGIVRPGELGADVCHLNLHKTFCIPHGGGGPGMGPIAVAAHLAPFLPSHPVIRPASAGTNAIGPVSAAPYGSPSILPISWMYIAMMGGEGLTRATQIAILNANYMARRLSGHYDILYTGANGLVAHEFIVDCRAFDKTAGVKIDDIAKRLMDYGFHAPTMS
ncbi:MAG: aminomethyl-transferring glycine dehydrogenase, partial [Planctomycetota bacterium]